VDSTDAFLADIIRSNGELEEHDNPRLRDVFVREATPAFEWLRELGVQFFGPTPEPPFRNPRMHNVVPNSRAYITALMAEAVRTGVEIRTNAPVVDLLVEGGRVTGVRSQSPLRARAVILGTGDFSASADLKRRWVSEQTARIPAVNPSNTGDGLVLALRLGAEIRNEWRVIEDLRLAPSTAAQLVRRLPTGRSASRAMRLAIERMPQGMLAPLMRRLLASWVAPSLELYRSGAILVNAEGHRFADELGNVARALSDQVSNRCWIVFDAAVAEKFSAWPHPVSTFPGLAYAYLRDYARARPDAYHESRSLDGLAASIGVTTTALQTTVLRFNDAAASGHDAAFGRAELGAGLVRPPFFALGPLSAFVTITDGGVLVDENCRVLRDGVPIDGLYAVGSTGQGGLILKNHGLHISWAVASGRVAGRAVAEDV
jgi:fumarate reductase flavoprotein subunit